MNKNYNPLGFYSKFLYDHERLIASAGRPPSGPQRFNGITGLEQYLRRKLQPGEKLETAVTKFFVRLLCSHLGSSHHWPQDLTTRNILIERLHRHGFTAREFIQRFYRSRSPLLRSVVALVTRSEAIHKSYIKDHMYVRRALAANPYLLRYLVSRLLKEAIKLPASSNVDLIQLIARHPNISRTDLEFMIQKRINVMGALAHPRTSLATIIEYTKPKYRWEYRWAAFNTGRCPDHILEKYKFENNINIRGVIAQVAPNYIVLKMVKKESHDMVLRIIFRRKSLPSIPVSVYERIIQNNPDRMVIPLIAFHRQTPRLARKKALLKLQTLVKTKTDEFGSQANRTKLLQKIARRLRTL